jgi:uncharacterized spore protein YtfJ
MDVSELLSRIDQSVTVGRSFGPAYEKDDCLVIPVAWVAGGGGGGSGTRPSTEGPEPSSPGAASRGRQEGSGGGFGTVAWPLGVYVVKDGQVRWVPALDVTRLLLAGAGMVRALSRLRSRRRLAAGGG